VSRTTTWALAALVCVSLAGCADNTGAMDDKGHNGYDEMTCQDVKILAYDLEHSQLAPSERASRTQQVKDVSAKAGDPAVRQLASAFVKVAAQGDAKVISSAGPGVEKICSF
jgi:major membrane immunogen (membrane-anchored lipoprotein)